MHIDQIYGSLLGLVLADAIGARFEGLPPEQLHRSVDSPSAAFAYSIGRDSLRYTDDGQMALVVAEYLTNHESIHWDELMDDFVAAYEPWRGYGRGARALLESFYDRENYEFKAQHLFPAALSVTARQ